MGAADSVTASSTQPPPGKSGLVMVKINDIVILATKERGYGRSEGVTSTHRGKSSLSILFALDVVATTNFSKTKDR